MSLYDQWIRRVGLVVSNGTDGIDLSEFRIRFRASGADVETPNSCSIRVYNLSKETINRIQGSGKNRGEFNEVILNAGYQNGNYGIIFTGSIRQFRIGRESETDTYLDILAADGDVAYNQGFVNTALSAGKTPVQSMQVNIDAMQKVKADLGLDIGTLKADKQHIPAIRGQVMFGMARARMRNIATHLDAGWGFQDGHVVVIDNAGYREGEAVEINISTGLIGMPEQTDEGIRVRCLLNSRIRIGSAVKLNNSEITQLMERDPDSAPIPYTQRTGFYRNAPLSDDGFYRVFAIDHDGDTRGNNWYSDLTCLAIDQTVAPDTSVDPR